MSNQILVTTSHLLDILFSEAPPIVLPPDGAWLHGYLGGIVPAGYHNPSAVNHSYWGCGKLCDESRTGSAEMATSCRLDDTGLHVGKKWVWLVRQVDVAGGSGVHVYLQCEWG